VTALRLAGYSAAELADVTPCHGCGTPTPYVLLDAKPSGRVRWWLWAERRRIGRAAARGADFDVLLCDGCYGPGWLPV